MAETNAAFLKTHLPNVEIVQFKDGIHDLELQKPEAVVALVLEFLAKDGTNERDALDSDSQMPR
jgi:pimeloyl-ACP methyl ester carboxylesterase